MMRVHFIFKYCGWLIFVVFIGALSVGCATPKKAKVSTFPVLVSSSHKKPPSWITDIPEEKRYYFYVGTSTDSESFSAGKKVALSEALSQVVTTIGVRVTAAITYEERYFAEQYTTKIESELLTEGKAKLQDAEIREIYYERYGRPDGTFFFRVWILLKYSKDEIAKEQRRLAEILELKYGEVRKFEERAAEYEQKRMLIEAVFAHLSASVAALKIDDGDVFFDRNIIDGNELLMKLHLRKLGENQIGYVGEPLPEPLQLKVYWVDNGEEIPIANVPIRFSYRVPKIRSDGYKILVANTTTDSKGIATYWVENLYEVSDENRVNAQVDLSAFLSQLKSAPLRYRGGIESLKDVLSAKRTIFRFKSDTYAREIKTAVYFLQFDVDDKPLFKPVTAPVINALLYHKHFSARVLDVKPSRLYGKTDSEILDELDTRSGKDVQRIIFGKVRIIEYDTISGFETARAIAEASLYERETGEIIKSWQLQRSGTGSTKDGAQINVLTQIGKSLGELLSNTMP